MAIIATGNEVLVNATTLGEQSWPRVAFVPGGYIVTWIGREDLQDAGSGHAVYFQRFDLAGNKVDPDGSPLDGLATSNEVKVNTTAAGDQFPSAHSLPRRRQLRDHVVESRRFHNDVYARFYDSTGTAITGELRISDPVIAGRQAEPDIAVLGTGYVINWGSSQGDGSEYGVFAQRLDGSGNFLTQNGSASPGVANFLVNGTTNGTQGWNSVNALNDGRVLHTYSSPDSYYYGVKGRIMGTNGVLGPEFSISADISYVDYQIWSDAIQLANGTIVVAWTAGGEDGSGYGIYARLFDTNGIALGEEFRVNVNVWGQQGEGFTHGGPSMAALADGGFAIAWHSDTNDGSARSVVVRHFDALGRGDGGETVVNQYTSNHQFGPDLLATNDGFRVFWHSEGQDGNSWGVYTRDFDVTAFQPEQQIVRTGGEDQVNRQTALAQQDSQVVSFADGSYVITWVTQTGLSTGDGSGWGIFGQRYNASGQQVGNPFQVNQYTAGDQGNFNGQSYHISHNSAALTGNRFIVTWDIQGTVLSETISIQDYVDATFSSNFRNSGDTITVSGAAKDFFVSFDGGNFVQLTSLTDNIHLTLPVQAGFGITLVFETAPDVLDDTRMLRLVADTDGDGLNELYLGNQQIEAGGGEFADPFVVALQAAALLGPLAGQSAGFA